MAEPVDTSMGKLGALAGKWTGYSALCTFLLYLLGYLALRFQLSVYGVATSLDAFDEKYMFAGSRFLVFLVSSVPNVLVIVFVLIAIGYLPYKLIPASAKAKLMRLGATWIAQPARLPLAGTLLAVLFIQLVLRKCFVFGNLLLAKELPPYEWIRGVLLTGSANRSLYFSGLVGGTLITGTLLWMAWRQATATPLSKVLVGLLFFLFGVEFLLLPVNYGILIASQLLPRVSEIGGEEKPQPGQQSWLIWESKEALIYFVQEGADSKRSVITVPRKETKIKVVAYDRIFQVLFGDRKSTPPRVSQEADSDE
jgi:hypothetical protein